MKADLISLADLSSSDIESIWSEIDAQGHLPGGTVAWSFEGNGIRTRTTFVQAFRELGLGFTELPNLLKTDERVEDLAGYLDPFYSAYVVRESNHERLQAFARASTRPVVNAMSSAGHPCEVLADALFVRQSIEPLQGARICLWGPPTNVFRSWHELAQVLGFKVLHVCEPQFHGPGGGGVEYLAQAPSGVDLVITDSWPRALASAPVALSLEAMAQMGLPRLLPTPPFTVGKELQFDPREYPGFVGYAQKRLLVPVQRAVLRFVLGSR